MNSELNHLGWGVTLLSLHIVPYSVQMPSLRRVAAFPDDGADLRGRGGVSPSLCRRRLDSLEHRHAQRRRRLRRINRAVGRLYRIWRLLLATDAVG